MEQEVDEELYQWNFVISGLIPKEVKLKRKIWLKKGVLLLDKKGEDLNAYLLGNQNIGSCDESQITPYLWMSSLVSNNAAELASGGGCSIASKDKLGTEPILSCTISTHINDEAVKDIEKYTHKFINFIGKLHDKYIDIISDNSFMSIALDYFHDSEKKFVYSDEGFISAMISLESLFNEGPSDIKYKLSHRAAFLLGLCDIDPIKVFQNLKTFYNHRSKLVHGAGSTSKDSDRYLISHYTRKAIIIFLILLNNKERQAVGKKKRKIKILEEIDIAMLDADRRKAIKQEIRKGLKDFKLKIPRTFEGSGKNGKYRVTAW